MADLMAALSELQSSCSRAAVELLGVDADDLDALLDPIEVVDVPVASSDR